MIRIPDREDERGVSAIIVAIALLAIFAMVVLVVDMGALLVKRRAMVKAADAAALAAAQSCVRETGDAEGQADTFAGLNAQGSLTGGIIAGGCDGTYVTVRYQTQQGLFFAPVLGFGSSDTVGANATAAWGSAGEGRPVPFVLSSGTFQSSNCDIPHIPKDTQCNFWFDNGGGGAGGFGGGLFGSLNLNKWDWSGGGGSKELPANRDYAAAGGYPTPLPLNYPDPTWVCAGSGLATPIYDALAENKGKVITFPIAESSTPVAGKFNIIGFTQVLLVDVIRAKSAQGGDSGTCTINQHFDAGQLIDLDEAAAAGCPVPDTGKQADTVSTPTVTGCTTATTGGTGGTGGSKGGGKGGGSGGGTKAVPCDGRYTYDPATHVLTWGSQPTDTQVTVSYDWQVYGECGPPASNNSGYCLIVKWEGTHFGGGKVIPGQDFGLDSIRLCDLKYAGSCPTSG
jgi:hypothetical protein